MVRWEILKGIGAYVVAGELSGEEAREVEHLILKDPEVLGLAESYTHLLAFLGTVGREEAPVPPRAIIDSCCAVRDRRCCSSACTPRAPGPHEPSAGEGRARKPGQEDRRKEGRKSDG